MRHAIRLIAPDEAARRYDELLDLLVDAVDSGASVNFVWPMTRGKAAGWWGGAFASHARGERLILIAEREGRIDGMVHLVPAPMENQAHRADVAKMLVHSRARRQGVGAALLTAAEAEARRIGRTLLTLDTEKASAGERLYARLGWTPFGEVPGYAMRADGSEAAPCVFFYKMLGGDAGFG